MVPLGFAGTVDELNIAKVQFVVVFVAGTLANEADSLWSKCNSNLTVDWGLGWRRVSRQVGQQQRDARFISWSFVAE